MSDKPIDMILFCPECGEQHIDKPESSALAADAALFGGDWPGRWTNPPHRSHLCHRCKCIWRPADVPTNGVAKIKTRGSRDGPSSHTYDDPLGKRTYLEKYAALQEKAVALTRALSDLVRLKRLKTAEGKTEEYLNQVDAAWKAAFNEIDSLGERGLRP